MQVFLFVVLSIAFLLLVVALLPWLNKRAARVRRSMKKRDASAVRTSFKAVSIRRASGACQAVQELGEQRFLTGQAPQLPLSECTANHCNCRYVHHPDRRDGKGDRRFSLSGAKGIVPPEIGRDRRRGPDRRRAAWA